MMKSFENSILSFPREDEEEGLEAARPEERNFILDKPEKIL